MPTELPAVVVRRLVKAVEAGFVLVPVTGATLLDNLEAYRVRFLPVTVPSGEKQSRDCFVVFSSQEALVDSGLSADILCVSPNPIDLLQVVEPTTWIALDPRPSGVTSMPLVAFLALWSELMKVGVA